MVTTIELMPFKKINFFKWQLFPHYSSTNQNALLHNKSKWRTRIPIAFFLYHHLAEDGNVDGRRH
jgi:hypothetical protein